MDKKFSVNIGKDKDKADARKRKDPQKLLITLAFVFAGVMVVGIVSVLVITKQMFGSGEIVRDNPFFTAAIVATVTGGAMMALFIALSLVVLIKESKNIAALQPEVRYTADDSIFKDPRIKQLPEVQRLMQYESVQRAFFDGQFPSDPKAASDPHLRELIDVLSKLADENGVIRL